MPENISPAPHKTTKPKPDAAALAIELSDAHVLGSLPGQSLEYSMLDAVLALMIRHHLRIDHELVVSTVRAAIAETPCNTEAFVQRCLALFSPPDSPAEVPGPSSTNQNGA